MTPHLKKEIEKKVNEIRAKYQLQKASVGVEKSLSQAITEALESIATQARRELLDELEHELSNEGETPNI